MKSRSCVLQQYRILTFLWSHYGHLNISREPCPFVTFLLLNMECSEENVDFRCWFQVLGLLLIINSPKTSVACIHILQNKPSRKHCFAWNLRKWNEPCDDKCTKIFYFYSFFNAYYRWKCSVHLSNHFAKLETFGVVKYYAHWWTLPTHPFASAKWTASLFVLSLESIWLIVSLFTQMTSNWLYERYY